MDRQPTIPESLEPTGGEVRPRGLDTKALLVLFCEPDPAPDEPPTPAAPPRGGATEVRVMLGPPEEGEPIEESDEELRLL